MIDITELVEAPVDWSAEVLLPTSFEELVGARNCAHAP